MLPENVDTVDEARADARFQDGKHVALFPHPAYAQLRLHLMFRHYQAAIWKKALKLQSALSLRDGG